MTLYGVKDWICDFLHSPCTTPVSNTFLKPFHHTVCFFHKVICDGTESKNTNNIQDINFFKRYLHRNDSKCHLTHHFSDVVEKVCSPSCNVTYLQAPIKSQNDDNTCNINDYFNIWFNESTSVLTEVNCEANNEQNRSIQDYSKFWMTELHKKLCDLVDCMFKPKMQLVPKPELIIIEGGSSRIRNWISQNLGIQCPRNVNFIQFIIYFCTIGGTVLFIILFVRKQIFKSKTNPESLSLENVDANLVQMFMDVLETIKNDCEKLKEQNSDLRFEMKEALDQVKEYNNQIGILSQQLHDLQESLPKEKDTIKEINEELVVGELKQNLVEHQEKIIENLQQTKTDEVCVNLDDPLNESITHSHEETPEEAATTEQEDPLITEGLKLIDKIFKNTQDLEKQIEEFSGSEEDKIFLHLNEMLIRNTLKLDVIESGGHFVIRIRRKKVLQYIQNCQRILKSKVIN